MSLNFNSRGFLHTNVLLSYKEFTHYFGTNTRRMDQITNALQFFRIFHTCGCQTVYVDGSFVSKKQYPEDIDLCFDLTEVDIEKIEQVFPEFFDRNEIGKIRRDKLCHIFTFSPSDTDLFNMLQYDREGNLKGFIKLNLKDLPFDL